MTDSNEKLKILRQSVVSDTQAEASRIIDEAVAKKQEILRAAENEYLDEVFKDVQDDIKKIKTDYLKKISQKNFEIKRQTLEHRTVLIDKLFDELEKRLEAFVNSDQYDTYLENALAFAEKQHHLGSSAIISVKAADAKRPFLLERFGERLIVDPSIRIGGLTVFYPKDNLFCDQTLDSSLEEHKSEFINNFKINY